MSDLLVLATIAGKPCAFRAHDVQSVIELQKSAPIPRSPDCIVGLAALRSQALTVVDCRTLLGIEACDFVTDERAIVVRVDGHTYALRVDRIEDIASATGEADAVPGGSGGNWQAVSSGMVETAGGPVLLLDHDRLIAGILDAARAA